MAAVSFASEQIDFSLKNESQIIEWLIEVCHSEGFDISSLTFVFCSDDYLLDINKKYLNHDYYTDVITFDYCEGTLVAGDIFISVDRVRENAQDLGLSEEEELHRIMVHGLLHLLGYSDKNKAEKAQMTLKEDFYLSSQAF